MKPLISVIIPTYNSAQTLERAVLSIQKQTYKNLQIIIIDDFSTDDTFAKAQNLTKEDSRIKVYKSDFNDPSRYDDGLKRNINAGYSARNTGFKYAKGEYITFQDADDVSLLNRIEIQYNLLIKHKAIHVCTDCQKFDEKLVGTCARIEAEESYIGPKEIYNMSQRSKGLIAKVSPTLNSKISFRIKRMRIINKLFFGSLENYPGAGNSPLFKREVTEKVQFRALKDRIWPSFMGRGADRDFNFQVAETFKNSYFFPITTYLWKTKH